VATPLKKSEVPNTLELPSTTISNGTNISPTLRPKPQKTLGFIKRILKECKPPIRPMAYQTTVRPSLEYASSVWDPYYQNMKKVLEGVHRRAARFVTSNYRNRSPGSMTHMIHQLQWDTLVEHRRTSRLIMLYKISHGIVDIHAPTYLTPGDNRTRGARIYLQLSAGKDFYDNSFPCTIRHWNNLPPTVRLANSIEAFCMLLTTTQAA
jgi:hypothetical protein